jgi:hypothetical protein
MDGEQGAIVADPNNEVVETPEAEPTPLPTVEELATELGWKPEDQWDGPKEKYRDPAEYIKAGQHGKLVKQVKRLEETTERMARTAAQTTARMLAEQEADLTAKYNQQVKDGDAAAAFATGQELNAVHAAKSAPDPAVADFVARNTWFNVDPDATDFAAAISQRLAQQGKSVSEQLAAAEAGTRKRFPELFDDPPPRRQAPVVATPNGRTAAPPKREKGFAEMDAAAQAGALEFEAMAKEKGMDYTRHDYAKTFWAERA